MEALDWTVMLATLLGIAGYGIWKTRHVNSAQSYMLGDRDLKWWSIGLSIMATQASDHLLSTPGKLTKTGWGLYSSILDFPWR
ncbi:MAG: hypothetical protein IPK21_13535 [Haliscomenobacter sp.]|nr:hypothetical protein [Haliscomenobacter sp.]